MWCREQESNNQKLNFASVAATGAIAPLPPSSTTSSTTSNSKFMDEITTQQSQQVDITKAPGYRGNVSSPVSSTKSSVTPPGYNLDQPIRPIGIITSSQLVDVVGLPGPIGPPPFSARTNFQNMTRTVAPDPTQLYNCDHQSAMMIPFHQLNSPPPPPPPIVAPTNPNVSMSRLNPRAPDFSVSYVPKPTQQQQQQTIFHQQQQQQQQQQHLPHGYNGQSRWSSYSQDVVTGYPGHNILQSVDLLSPFENGTGGNSPTMSPSSPTPPTPCK